MATYPPRGTPLWDTPLKEYLDGVEAKIKQDYELEVAEATDIPDMKTIFENGLA